MTDKDREVDGADGGSAGAASGAGATRAQSQPPTEPPANVVPFPGNWFGSVDELVPVHSEPEPVAAHPERDRGQSRPKTAHVVPPLADLPGVFGGPMRRPVAPVPAAEPPAASAADASDFWEGDAAALTEVPAATESRSSIALLRSPGAAKRKPVADVADEPHRSTGPAGDVAGDRPAASRGHRANRTNRPVVMAAALLVAAAGVLLLVPHLLAGARGSGASRHHGLATATTQRESAAVVTETLTSPAVTVTTRQRARRHRHHSPRSRAGGRHPSTGGSHPSTSSSGSAAHASASDSGPVNGGTAPPNSAVVASQSSGASSGSGSASSGTRCAAQSPDSGCLP